MPVVHVYMWSGRPGEVKEKVIEGITKVFTDIGVPREAVTVIIHEISRDNWGMGGKPASKAIPV
jgi:4-oxalocrotonate tautomerase